MDHPRRLISLREVVDPPERYLNESDRPMLTDDGSIAQPEFGLKNMSFIPGCKNSNQLFFYEQNEYAIKVKVSSRCIRIHIERYSY